MTGPIRLLVADDHPVVRDGLRGMLAGQPDLEVVGEAADGAEAVALAPRLRPDVVLMDLRMPGMDGIQATQTLRRQQPETPVVLWTGHDDAQLASAVRSSGAQAGVAKGVCTVDLIAALRDVCNPSR